MTKYILLAFAVAIVPLATRSSFADDPQPITWSDLVPDDTYPDPFKKLSPKQLEALSFVVRIHHLLAAKKVTADGPEVKEAAKIERSLIRDGIDIGWLVAQRRRVGQMREIQAKAVQQNVVGKVVRLSGYIVPLKASDGLVTEFFLVPNPAACSHATPPPPNQVVYVQSREGVAVRSRVTAVKVTGRIEAKEVARTILSASGPIELTTAYVIAPEAVEVYSAGK
jgi:hypothetical protein